MLIVQGNSKEIVLQLNRAAGHVPEAGDVALQRVGEVVTHSAARFIGAIYKRPPNGWKRTGDLQRGLKQQRNDATHGQVVITGRAAKYARFRHDLNKPGKDGITRHNPYFDQARVATEPQILPVFENEFQNELDKYLPLP